MLPSVFLPFAPDEFGNQFEVNNCSACYHWVTTKPPGHAVFSAGYKGCHVLEKVGTAQGSLAQPQAGEGAQDPSCLWVGEG